MYFRTNGYLHVRFKYFLNLFFLYYKDMKGNLPSLDFNLITKRRKPKLTKYTWILNLNQNIIKDADETDNDTLGYPHYGSHCAYQNHRMEIELWLQVYTVKESLEGCGDAKHVHSKQGLKNYKGELQRLILYKFKRIYCEAVVSYIENLTRQVPVFGIELYCCAHLRIFKI